MTGDWQPQVPDEHRALVAQGRWAELWEHPGPVALVNHGSYGRPFRAVTDLQHRLRRQVAADPAAFYRHGFHDALRHAAARVHDGLGLPPSTRVGFRHNASTALIDAVVGLSSPPAPVLVTNLGYGGVRLGVEQLGRLGIPAEVVDLPTLPSPDLLLEHLADHVARARPGVVVVDEITSDTAMQLPVPAMVDAIGTAAPHARVVIDGAHAGGMATDPAAGLADAWITDLHKWPCAGHGAAVVAAPADSPVRPLQASWSAPEGFPDSFLWTGTDDVTAFLTAPVALELLDELLAHGLDAHARSLLAQAADVLATAWDVAPDARPPGTGAPWMRLVEVPLPDGATVAPAQLDGLMAAARAQRAVDVALTGFADRLYLRLSAHGYNQPRDYERLVDLPALVAAHLATA